MPRRPQDRDLLAAVGARIKSARQRAGLSQEDLAAAADLAPHSVSRFETGHLAATLTTFAAIARALGVELADLVDVEAPMPERQHAADTNELTRLYEQLSPVDRGLVIGLARLAYAIRRER